MTTVSDFNRMYRPKQTVQRQRMKKLGITCIAMSGYLSTTNLSIF